MIRTVDELGRIVLPAEYRQALGLQENDKIEMLLQGNEIVIKKMDFSKKPLVFSGKTARY